VPCWSRKHHLKDGTSDYLKHSRSLEEVYALIDKNRAEAARAAQAKFHSDMEAAIAAIATTGSIACARVQADSQVASAGAPTTRAPGVWCCSPDVLRTNRLGASQGPIEGLGADDAPVLFINQEGTNTLAGKAELLAKALDSLSRPEPGKNLAIPGHGPSQIHHYPPDSSIKAGNAADCAILYTSLARPDL
jgi:hypothetical protein